MAFNIAEFVAQVNDLGVAQSNLFFSILTPPAGLGDTITANELKFLCRTVDIPEMSVGTTDYKPSGFGTSERRPTSFNHEPITAVFVVDSKFRVLQFFHAWMQLIVNYDTQAGPNSKSPSGARVYEFGFKEDYISNMSVSIFSNAINDSSNSYTYTFGNIFPISIGNISVAWENSAEVLVLPITFSFDTMVVDGASRGTISNEVIPSIISSDLINGSEVQTSIANLLTGDLDRLGSIYENKFIPANFNI